MDNNKEWYVFLKEGDMSINDDVDMKIILPLEEQLKFQTEVAAMTEWNREWTRCRTKLNNFYNNML